MTQTRNFIDLHVHSTYSDGELTPSQLFQEAEKKNIRVLALADHDTISGIEYAMEEARRSPIIFIPGIEMNAKVSKGQMHILGYFINYKAGSLKKKLQWLVDGRNKRNNEFISLFNKLGFRITLRELQEVAGSKVIGKPHFAKIFLDKGYIKEKNEIFNTYFNQPLFKEIREYLYSPKEVIEIITESGGIPVLAHPQTLNLNNIHLENTIVELKSYGLAGLECYHSNQTKEQMAYFKSLAKKYDLLITKGSDYHGPVVKPNIMLGTGVDNNIVLPEKEEEQLATKLIHARQSYYSRF